MNGQDPAWGACPCSGESLWLAGRAKIRPARPARYSGARIGPGPPVREIAARVAHLPPADGRGRLVTLYRLPPFRFAFFSKLSYWCDMRCAWIWAMKSITTTTTISSEVPPK